MQKIRTPFLRQMTKQEILDLGIEIVSAMKATCYNWDMEEGRIDALMETEIDRLEGVGVEEFNTWDDDLKLRVIASCKREKERLHKQAIFVANATIDYIKKITDTPKEFCKKHRTFIEFKTYGENRLIHLLINIKNRGIQYDKQDIKILKRGMRGNLHLEFAVKQHFLKKYKGKCETPKKYYFE